jgi:hypothetical protein
MPNTAIEGRMHRIPMNSDIPNPTKIRTKRPINAKSLAKAQMFSLF